jgi:hypothetical protein
MLPDIAMSYDGKYRTLVINTYYLYTSSDYGVSWTLCPQIFANALDRVSVSRTGQYQVCIAATTTNNIYYSSDYGASWVLYYIAARTDAGHTASISASGNTIYGSSNNSVAMFTLNIPSNFIIPNTKVGDGPFTLTNPISDSTGTFSYTSSNTSVATISGNTVTIVGKGSSKITATQAVNSPYPTGTISALLNVTSDSWKINANTYSNTSGINGEKFTLLSNIFITKIKVPFMFVNGFPIVSIIKTTNSIESTIYTGNFIEEGDYKVVYVNTDLSTGVYDIRVQDTAKIWLNCIYNMYDASIFQSLTSFVSTNGLTIFEYTITPTIGTFTVLPKTYGDAAFTLTNPSSDSSGTFSYTSNNMSIVTISGNNVTIIGGGSATIKLTQAAYGNYVSATRYATFEVTKLATTITTNPTAASITE